MLAASLGAALFGFASLFLAWPGYWPYWTLIAVALVIAVGLQSRNIDSLFLRPVEARIVSAGEERDLHSVLNLLAGMADISAPRLAVSASQVPTAFTFGFRPSRATVVVTEGLRVHLDPQEVEAVLAHEMSHIANRDALVMTAASLPRTLGSHLFSGEGFGVYIWFFLWPFGFLLWGLSTLLTFALSRYRELAADRGSALLTGTPEQLMSALQKLSSEMSSIPERDLRAVSGLDALFIVTAAAQPRRFAFLSNHPPLDTRLEKLAHVARELGSPSRA